MSEIIKCIPLLSDITIATDAQFRIDDNTLTVLSHKGTPVVGVCYIYINMAFIDYTNKYYFSANLLDTNKKILYSFVHFDDSIIDSDPYSQNNKFLRETLQDSIHVCIKILLHSKFYRIKNSVN